MGTFVRVVCPSIAKYCPPYIAFSQSPYVPLQIIVSNGLSWQCHVQRSLVHDRVSMVSLAFLRLRKQNKLHWGHCPLLIAQGCIRLRVSIEKCRNLHPSGHLCAPSHPSIQPTTKGFIIGKCRVVPINHRRLTRVADSERQTNAQNLATSWTHR